MAENSVQVDVMIVGAGPTGLTLALALHRLGLRPLIVDRQEDGANTSRAAVIHARTLEVLADLGVTDALLARGLKVPVFRVRDRSDILLSVDFTGIDSRYPFTLMLPQNKTEVILREYLRAAGGTVERPVELIEARIGEHGVEAMLRSGAGDRKVSARWIVGCDGGHSTVRQAAGIAFEGGDYKETFVLADVAMDWPLPRDEVDLFLSRDGLVVVAPLPDERFRIVATDADAAHEISQAYLMRLLSERGPLQPAVIHDVTWTSSFGLHHRVASAPWRGHVLLCGDAAHMHSPAGGQGMNTGIQDAAGLAPALAVAVARGGTAGIAKWATQRHAVAKDVVSLTDRMTRLATIRSPIGRTIRNTLLPLAGSLPLLHRRLARRLAELDYR